MQRSVPRFVQLVGLVVLTLAGSAIAGPPLICHAFDIGAEKSLPWTGSAWNLSGNENYDTANLVHDTLALMDTNAPVIVRMETLRRASLYARKDPRAAKELLTRLHSRAMAGDTSRQNALALFDFGFLVETYHQWLKDQDPAAGLDGYSLVKRALTLHGNDPEMEFAAALITLRGPQQAHLEHSRRAIAGAKADSLLARNLASRFLGDNKLTVAEALTLKTNFGGGQQ